MSEEKNVEIVEKKGKDMYEWVQALVWAVVAVVLLFSFAIRLIGVDGGSMRCTLESGDRLLVVSPLLYNDYKPGDIVVARKESFMVSPIVKRVIAVEGQMVDIDPYSGSVYVDGVMLEEDYIREPNYTIGDMQFPLVVEEGCVFLLGDNRNASTDSRFTQCGLVDERHIMGKAVMLLMPGENPDIGSREFSRIGWIG